MSEYFKKLDAVTRTAAYRNYSELMGAALALAALGAPFALAEYIELQKEQAQLVRNAMEKQR